MDLLLIIAVGLVKHQLHGFLPLRIGIQRKIRVRKDHIPHLLRIQRRILAVCRNGQPHRIIFDRFQLARPAHRVVQRFGDRGVREVIVDVRNCRVAAARHFDFLKIGVDIALFARDREIADHFGQIIGCLLHHLAVLPGGDIRIRRFLQILIALRGAHDVPDQKSRENRRDHQKPDIDRLEPDLLFFARCFGPVILHKCPQFLKNTNRICYFTVQNGLCQEKIGLNPHPYAFNLWEVVE